jgi:hypothetical protein
MPALSHLLSIEQGKVLSLAADEAHVYAGCQSEDNEITVRCRWGIVLYANEIGVLEVYSTTAIPPDWARGERAGFTRDQGERLASQLE